LDGEDADLFAEIDCSSKVNNTALDNSNSIPRKRGLTGNIAAWSAKQKPRR